MRFFIIGLFCAEAALISWGVSRLAHADPVAATDVISKQIGWLVIQNANLQAEVEDLRKQVEECKK